MRKTLLALSIIILLSFAAEKTYTVTYTVYEWQSKLQLLEYTKNAIKQSDLPTKISLPLIDSLTLFQNQINQQVSKQLSDTTKKK